MTTVHTPPTNHKDPRLEAIRRLSVKHQQLDHQTRNYSGLSSDLKFGLLCDLATLCYIRCNWLARDVHNPPHLHINPARLSYAGDIYRPLVQRVRGWKGEGVTL